MKIHNTPRQTPQFKGLLHLDEYTGNVNDSWFYRDTKTLNTVTDNVRKEFPNGADILDYASSSGEEAISLKTLLPESKYRIIGYDNSLDALKLAKKGVYTVFSNWYDSYLLPDDYTFAELALRPSKNDMEMKEKRLLRDKFNDVMVRLNHKPMGCNINNKSSYNMMKYSMPNFVEYYYQVKDSYKSNVDIRYGNILNVGKFRKEKPVGAILFRNAAYHLCENNINEVIEFNSNVGIYPNKRKLFNFIAENVYKTLDYNGVFAIGDHIKDHLFWADESTPIDETIKFSDTPFYNPKSYKHVNHADVRCYKNSPFVEALTRNNMFEAIGFSFTELDGKKIKVPTVWRKIRI